MLTGSSFRLPTEAEWEYAVRAETVSEFYWGNRKKDDFLDREFAVDYAWFDENSGEYTNPIGRLKPNDFGLYDMSGNVWEWVQDCWHNNYKNAPNNGSAWEEDADGDCNRRIIRGGCWYSGTHGLRFAYRNWGDPIRRLTSVGFRLAQDLP